MLPKYKVHGEGGMPMFFLGGMMQPHELLGPFVNIAIKEGFQVVRIGYRGHHAYDSEDFSLDDITQDTINVLDYLNIKKVYLVGEALGGTIALLLAQKYPDRINAVCVNGVISKRDSVITQLFLNWYQILKQKGIEELISQIMPYLFSPEWASQNMEEIVKVSSQLAEERTKDGLVALFKCTQRFRFPRAAISSIQIPILIISSKKDIVVPPDHANNLHSLLQNSQLIEFDSGHALSCECPNQLIETFKQFINELLKK